MKESKQNYFIYTGNAYPHKNLERAIRAAAKMKITFYIVSSRNVFTKRLEKLIQRLKAKDYVKLLGYVEDSKLKELYKDSVGFIYPSLAEGFGLPGLEAMKVGTLVLSSSIPVFREIYGDNVIYFDPLNVQSIEEAIKMSLEINNKEREIRIKKAQEFVKKYSWEKMAKEILEVYCQCYN